MIGEDRGFQLSTLGTHAGTGAQGASLRKRPGVLVIEGQSLRAALSLGAWGGRLSVTESECGSHCLGLTSLHGSIVHSLIPRNLLGVTIREK